MIDAAPSPSRSPGGWFVVWTESRAEKKVEGRIAALGLEPWLPTVTERRRWSDRWREVVIPVFPSYLFARVPFERWHSLIRVPGVLTVVKSGRQPAQIREEQMADLRLAVERLHSGKEEFEVEPYFELGDRVRVVHGPMAGLIGVVREIRGRRRLLVGFEQIGRALSVCIGSALVEICKPFVDSKSVAQEKT